MDVVSVILVGSLMVCWKPKALAIFSSLVASAFRPSVAAKFMLKSPVITEYAVWLSWDEKISSMLSKKDTVFLDAGKQL